MAVIPKSLNPQPRGRRDENDGAHLSMSRDFDVMMILCCFPESYCLFLVFPKKEK